MKKILVTGGCGFVGRHLVKRLSLDENNEITIVDDLSTGLRIEEQPEHLQSKVSRVIYDDCLNFFAANREHFDVIFHLAAIVEGRATIDGDPLKVAKDLIIDASMFRWAVETRPDKIIYFSSSAVYPIEKQTAQNNVALAESMVDVRRQIIAMPDMSYGWSKLTGEYLACLAVEKYNLAVAVYRPFSGYGEDQALSYPFPAIIKRVLESEQEITVWGSGEQSRDFIYIEDCISGILDTYEKINDASPLNLGTGQRTSFKELIQEACSITNKKLIIKPLADKPEGVYARYSDPAKQQELGFVPKYSLADGLKIFLDYMEKYGRR